MASYCQLLGESAQVVGVTDLRGEDLLDALRHLVVTAATVSRRTQTPPRGRRTEVFGHGFPGQRRERRER
jgi:hypothetical protein